MSFYFFSQRAGDAPWDVHLASERQNVIATQKPMLVSVLDVDSAFDHDLTREEIEALRYRGPLYFDFDGDLDEVIVQVQKFLVKLREERGVNLGAIRLYATGGRGFHVEIPPETVLTKVPANGIQHYPLIQREVAHALFVDTLDLRVYSGKRGRQWRCPNVERQNGRYKVQVTADEIFAMTVERYEQITALPRPPFPIAEPQFSPQLALLFSTAKDKVEGAVKRRKSDKKAVDALKKFKGEWPETVKSLLQGRGIRPDIGWNQIALQLALTAVSLGKTEDQLLSDAADLIANHKGDSSRYGTERKRREELRHQFRYLDNNPTYTFSVGGLLSLCTPDLKAESDIGEDDEVLDVEQIVEEAPRVRIGKNGIFVMAENGWKRVVEIGIDKPAQMRDSVTLDPMGYEVEVYLQGKFHKSDVIPMRALSSKSEFGKWSLSHGLGCEGTDANITALASLLFNKTRKEDRVVYTLTSEGLDYIKPPGATKNDEYEIIWSSHDGVLTTTGNQYRFRPTLDPNGIFRSDLPHAGDLSEADADLIQNLLNINTPENLGKMLGWFVAAFLAPVYRKLYNKFPSCQVFGPAGSGKTETVTLLNQLHYNIQAPKIIQAIGQTAFPMLCALAASSSIPVIFEEVKASEAPKTTMDWLRNAIRNNYNGTGISRGGVTKDASSSSVVVNNYSNRGPTLWIGEALETQTALIDRCVLVNLTKGDRAGRAGAFMSVARRRTDLGRLGKALMQATMALQVGPFRDQFDVLFDQLVDAAGSKAEGADRPMYNLAVVVHSLRFLAAVLRPTFGTRFDEKLFELESAITTRLDEAIPSQMPEASKVLDVLAQLSRSEEVQWQLVRGKDYTANDERVDIKMKPAYAKYVRYTRSLGQVPLFENEAAFIRAMQRYEGLLKPACPDNNELFDSPFTKIFAFDVAYMIKEQIELFKQ